MEGDNLLKIPLEEEDKEQKPQNPQSKDGDQLSLLDEEQKKLKSEMQKKLDDAFEEVVKKKADLFAKDRCTNESCQESFVGHCETFSKEIANNLPGEVCILHGYVFADKDLKETAEYKEIKQKDKADKQQGNTAHHDIPKMCSLTNNDKCYLFEYALNKNMSNSHGWKQVTSPTKIQEFVDKKPFQDSLFMATYTQNNEQFNEQFNVNLKIDPKQINAFEINLYGHHLNLYFIKKKMMLFDATIIQFFGEQLYFIFSADKQEYCAKKFINDNVM